jgi:arginine-tRNA-protein transferase
MFDFDPPFINEQFYSSHRQPHEMDALWNDGWRHFGTHFFRYNLGIYRDEIRRVVPLRIRLTRFSFSESQRRVLRKNAGLQTIIRPAVITPEHEAIFHRHKLRFDHGIPGSVYDFLSPFPAAVPTTTNEVCVYDRDRLVAVSFLDIGERATSAIYAMFEPELSARSLGIFMILKEIEYSIEQDKDFLHLGYSYEGPSFYDYKKRFRALEAFDWRGNWTPYKSS